MARIIKHLSRRLRNFHGLPPVVDLLVSESLWDCESPLDLRRLFLRRGLIKEASKEAQWSRLKYYYADEIKNKPSYGTFTLIAGDALNPMTQNFKCCSERCRLRTAKSFMQIAALYTDFVYVQDAISPIFLSVDDNQQFWIRLFIELQVLKMSIPLIREGILKFSRSGILLCEECQSAMTLAKNEAGRLVLDEILETSTLSSIEINNQKIVYVRSPHLTGPDGEIISREILFFDDELKTLDGWLQQQRDDMPIRNIPMLFKERLLRQLENDAASILIKGKTASRLHGILATASRLEALFVRLLEKGKDFTTIEEWETPRRIELPWVRDLTTEELIRLRYEAARALPRFRHLMATRVGDATTKPDESPKEIINELKEQSFDIEAEIGALGRKGKVRFALGLGGLSIGMTIYGLAATIPAIGAAGFAGLVATLLHLRGEDLDKTKTEASTCAKPGYILLKAKQLLQERHE